MANIVTRTYPKEIATRLVEQGVHPVLARIYAARGIQDGAQLQTALSGLIPPDRLTHADKMARILADAIAQGKKLLIVADYDADGATACAVAVRALRGFGAKVDYLVPNRFEHGYGLTPEIVHLAAQCAPDLIMTVDNGIASVEGVEAARRLGIPVLVTDHHLAGDVLPDAAAIVNPNAPSCDFPSKNLAGVGVIFYVMLALRAELRRRGRYAQGDAPNLAELLDLVALGTVADLVRLDDNNRILVDQGLRRIRAGKATPGILALLRVAGRDPRRVSTYDLGFVLGPRINAAGRLEDMGLGIACLLTEDLNEAMDMATKLDEMNRSRREIESGMHESALAALEQVRVEDGYSLSLADPGWHQGVIGILASRLKEKFHRPTVVFAPGGDGILKGSGRSIAGLHLRDALDLLSKHHPGLLLRFGGHAMAAGLAIRMEDFSRFAKAFEAVVQALLTPADLERIIETDGELDPAEHTLETALAIENGVWGQGFAAPAFHGQFAVIEQSVVGSRHLKLRLERQGKRHDAILFFHAEPLPDRIHAVYQLGIHEYNGTMSLQLTLRHWSPA
ncbi:MAG: single-stranded-DNA-specific exonuclease RecJ [Methylophilaceae bacterium]|nr:single-stranded-DNA-specific exonuclease RecJ [Methylophilaceae bacterium]